MHESSLVEFTLNAVEDKAASMNIKKVTLIHLTCGKMRGAIPQLMNEAFRLLTPARPMFHGAVLEMEETPIIAKCRACNSQHEIEEFHDITCPACGGKEYDIISGEELRIDYFEGE
ncbi:MAG: hydrogenase maturation nickel metallochaperone HypA [Eubacterium sp.]|nr:hydrogenase maturation nickel metallochaperone HypA [Candidatus Colimonas fimequi]